MGKEVTHRQLTEFALKLVTTWRGQAEGILRVHGMEDWSKEELHGVANLMLEDLREENPEALAELRRLYQETEGDPFKRVYYAE